MVKTLSSMQNTWVQSLGREDPLEKGMGAYSNILAWEIPWIEEPGGLQSMGSQRIRHNWATNTHTDLNINFIWKHPTETPRILLEQDLSSLWPNEVDSIPGMGRSSGRGHGNPLQYSCLENSIDRRAWQACKRAGHESDRAHTLFSVHQLF